jgi:hypothetical protein
VTARDPATVGRFPWLGMFSYSPETDPWKNHLGPRAEVPARTFMRNWCAARAGRALGGWGRKAIGRARPRFPLGATPTQPQPNLNEHHPQPRRYSALLQVLGKGGLKYPVRGAFLWNCASWDIQGTRDPQYADPVTVEKIRAHNANATGVARKAAKGAGGHAGAHAGGAHAKGAPPVVAAADYTRRIVKQQRKAMKQASKGKTPFLLAPQGQAGMPAPVVPLAVPQPVRSLGVGALPQQPAGVAAASVPAAAAGGAPVIVMPMMAPTGKRAWRAGM